MHRACSFKIDMKSKMRTGSKEAAMKKLRDGYSDTLYYSELLGTWHVMKGRPCLNVK